MRRRTRIPRRKQIGMKAQKSEDPNDLKWYQQIGLRIKSMFWKNERLKNRKNRKT